MWDKERIKLLFYIRLIVHCNIVLFPKLFKSLQQLPINFPLTRQLCIDFIQNLLVLTFNSFQLTPHSIQFFTLMMFEKSAARVQQQRIIFQTL
jgi:hypothetical protein